MLNSASSPQGSTMSATNKRASGRVRKQPELYTSSDFAASDGKRKRSNEEDGVDADSDREMPEDYVSEESEEDGEEEPDEEELRERRKRARKQKSTVPKKPAQKKPKVNGTSLPFRNATSGAKKKSAPKKAKAVNMEEAAAAGGLYAEVFASGNKLDDVAGTWLKRFVEHESGALAEVVNLVLKCAGCDAQVTDDDIEDPDGVTNRLDDIREEYQATEPTDYPLIVKGKVATSIRQGLTGFFDALIKAMAIDGVLYSNPVLMENVQIWVSTMSSAPNRSFRHTATVASLAIVTALCEVARDNAERVANNRRHAEAERKKSRVNAARVKDIEERVTQATIALEFVQPQLEDWFNVVFIHRYRDVDPVIRRDCIQALGDWVVTMPDVFFNGNHLRYMGWVLSDVSPATRGEVIHQLCRLYKEKDRVGGLRTFTEKFRPRMVEIATTDAETNVRVAGVEMLELLRENELLEPDDIDAVGRLIFDTDLRVRKAVATFFSENVNDICNGKMDDMGGGESLEEALPEVSEDNYEAPRVQWLKLKSLAELLQAYDADDALPSQVERNRTDGSLTLHIGNGDSRFTLAAEVLCDKMEEVQEWQLLAGYLLFDHSSGSANGVAGDLFSRLKHECVLTEQEEAILLEVLQASVKIALLGTNSKLKAPKSKLTKRQREELEEELEDAARQLSSLVPKLLKKFGDAPSTAAAVLRIEAVLSIDSLQHLRQDSTTYAALLDDVRKQFMSHSTDEVLAPASNAILHAKSYGELDDLTEEKVSSLWDDVISNLTELLDPKTVTNRGASEFEELTALSNNLLRIVRLSAVSDCIPHLEDGSVAASNDATGADYQGAIDYIIALVQRGQLSSKAPTDPDSAALEDEISARAAEAALFYCRWKLKNIIAAVTQASGQGVPFEELEALARRRDTYVEQLRLACETRKAGEDICISLMGCALDLYASAAVLRDVRPQPGISDDFTVLGMDLDEILQKLLMKVFAACEKNFAKLSGRKLEEAVSNGEDGDDAEAIDEDPVSDPESDDEDDEPSQQRKDGKTLATLLAEQKLCALTGKIVHTFLAGVMVDDAMVRKRLERNKTRLGPNYKELLAYLDINAVGKKQKGKAKTKKPAAASGNGMKSKTRATPKSNAIVAEDELDDEIEDVDGDDDEALKGRGLVNDNEPDDDEMAEQAAATNGADAEEGSVLGD